MSWVWQHLLGLWNLFWLIVLVIVFTSPFETLGWWAGWSRKRDRPEEPARPSSEPSDGPFLVYLTGVAGFSGEFLARRERGFLDRLRQRLPGARIVDDVFPFSATNNPLDGDRLFRWLWVWLQERRLKLPNNIFDVLIVVRNIAQTMVSSDPRYGPVYNLGVARELAASLLRQGYPPHRGVPVTIVAYSGGAQIGIGAAPYLKRNLGARVRVISLGGVMTDDPGILAVESLIDLKGTRDRLVPALGWLAYPGRWRPVTFSPWNRARRAGRIQFRACGPMTHVGGSDYFSRKATMPDGTCYGDYVADQVASIF